MINLSLKFLLMIFGSNYSRLKGHNKRPHRVDVTKLPPQSEPVEANGPTPGKVARMVGGHDPHDPNSSDHVVAVTQLKEKIAHLQKQLSQKDSQLLTKDRQVCIILIIQVTPFRRKKYIYLLKTLGT